MASSSASRAESETTIIANTLLNFNTITSPQVISQTSVKPP